MARTTSELRVLWAPPCEGPWARVELYGAGAVSVDPLIVPAVKALDACLSWAHYESDREDTGAFNCRHITGGTGYSLHSYGIALDINWQENPYGPVLHTDMPPAMIRAIEAIRTKGGVTVWRWGGRYRGNKDAMHFEVVCSPAELARGIDPATLPGGKPATNPTPRGFLPMLNDEEQEELLSLTRENRLVLAQVQDLLLGDDKRPEDKGGKGDSLTRLLASNKRLEGELAKVPKAAKPAAKKAAATAAPAASAKDKAADADASGTPPTE